MISGQYRDCTGGIEELQRDLRDDIIQRLYRAYIRFGDISRIMENPPDRTRNMKWQLVGRGWGLLGFL